MKENGYFPAEIERQGVTASIPNVHFYSFTRTKLTKLFVTIVNFIFTVVKEHTSLKYFFITTFIVKFIFIVFNLNWQCIYYGFLVVRIFKMMISKMILKCSKH